MIEESDVARAEQLLRQVDSASGALLDAITDEIVILDGSGTIIAVNEAWKRFAGHVGEGSLAAAGVGQNYLEVCERSIATGFTEAREVADGLRSVLRRATNQFVIEYEFVTPAARSWFLLTATALTQMPGALVTHRDITGARKTEEVLRLGGQLETIGNVYDSILPALVKNLASALNVRHAFLSELVDLAGKRARILAHWDGTGFVESRDYRLEGIPAEQILAGKACVFPAGVRRLFPGDQILAGADAESYLAVPLLDSSGLPLGHLGIVDTKPIEDVSFAEMTMRLFAGPAIPELQRRKVERQLMEQSRLIYNAPDAILGTDANLVITYWNMAAERTYGWRAEEVLGRPAQEILRTQYSAEDRQRALQAATEKGEFRGDVVQYRKDGSAINVGVTIMPIRNPLTTVTGFVCINRDISESVRTQEALRDAEARNRAILDAIPDMLFTVDYRGQFLSFTPSKDLEPLFPPSVFLGKTIEQIMPPDVASVIMRAIGACFRSNKTESVEYQLTEDGELRDYEARLVPIAAGEVLAIVRDSTTAKSQQRSLERFSGAALMQTGDKARVLVVDRDVRTLRYVRKVVEDAGKRALVTSDPNEALELAASEPVDVVILDISVFEDSDSNFFIELRRLSDAPVLVLGPSYETERGIGALKAGADDYIVRPFSAAELDTRVELARRHRATRRVPAAPMGFGDLVIDPARRLVTVCGERVALTPTEYKLLLEMGAEAGRVMTHDEILHCVWGPGYAGQYEVLRSFIRSLRRKLGDDARKPRFLASERGIGYSLIKPE